MFQIFFKKFGTYIEDFQRFLELSALRCAWEWDDITDVLHTGDEQDKTLETETETGMGA